MSYGNSNKTRFLNNNRQQQRNMSRTDSVEEKSPEISAAPEIKAAPVIPEDVPPIPGKKPAANILTSIADDIAGKKGEVLLKSIIYSEIFSKPISRRKGRR